MKKSCKAIFSLALALLMVMSLAATAFASSSVTFKGFTDGFDFQPGSEYTETDLFGSFKNVMPGDVLTETITFTNEADDCSFVKLYMRAEAHDEASNPLTYSETFENADGKDQANVSGERDETVATMSDFLAQLSMKVWNGTALIYDASPDETDGLRENVFLGTFRTGETAQLTVELTIPAELGSEYANRVGEVDWVFHVEACDETQLVVRKVWSDGSVLHKNDSVTVELLRNGEPVQTQQLSETNGWTYTFDRLAEGYSWSVREKDVSAGYTAYYKTEGNTTIIRNVRNTDPPPTPPDTPREITVRKVWSGDNAKERPEWVMVALYDGERLYDTVRLDAENGWSRTWRSLPAGDWQVVEINIPKGYTPSYRKIDNTVTITNTRTLIHTGQLRWPVYLLGGAGLLLLSSGGFVLMKKRRSRDA